MRNPQACHTVRSVHSVRCCHLPACAAMLASSRQCLFISKRQHHCSVCLCSHNGNSTSTSHVITDLDAMAHTHGKQQATASSSIHASSDQHPAATTAVCALLAAVAAVHVAVWTCSYSNCMQTMHTRWKHTDMHLAQHSATQLLSWSLCSLGSKDSNRPLLDFPQAWLRPARISAEAMNHDLEPATYLPYQLCTVPLVTKSGACLLWLVYHTPLPGFLNGWCHSELRLHGRHHLQNSSRPAFSRQVWRKKGWRGWQPSL
jgi:hypothetical protein